jgi:hypothetical protein
MVCSVVKRETSGRAAGFGCNACCAREGKGGEKRPVSLKETALTKEETKFRKEGIVIKFQRIDRYFSRNHHNCEHLEDSFGAKST